MSPRPPILIRGAGVIGLSLALELRLRGHAVRVVDQASPLGGASMAAAGMLAAEDPFNPPQLRELARYSVRCFPDFLHQIERLSGLRVAFQTDTVQQRWPDGATRAMPEHSIDPRQLGPALLAAVSSAGVSIDHVSAEGSMQARTNTSESPAQPAGQRIVYATGAWASLGFPVRPRKGQMLRVSLPADRPLSAVLRSAHLYIVPRTQGPQAGSALIGATLEDAGFDRSTSPEMSRWLRQAASDLLPGIEDVELYPELESWAGLRPSTPDELPILGALLPVGAPAATVGDTLVAMGHFRNGILLAPGTAAVLADLMEGRAPAVDLTPFSPARFPLNGPP